MKTYKLKDFKEGWVIGAFNPSILFTPEFEVAVKEHHAGEWWPEHYQKVATEYNIVVKGAVSIGDKVFYAGDIFVVEPMVSIKPEFLENTQVVVIKTPSLPGDKVVNKSDKNYTPSGDH